MSKARYNDDDLIVLDEEGIIQKPGKKRRKRKVKDVRTKDLVKVRTPEGELVWTDKTVDPDKLPHASYPYSEQTKDAVCILLAEGKTMTQIAKIEGFPPLYILYKWSKIHKDYREEVIEAKKMRADFYHDKVLQTAEETDSWKVARQNALKINAYKWAAEVNSPAVYGKKTTIQGNPDQPVEFVVRTGVPTKEVENDSD